MYIFNTWYYFKGKDFNIVHANRAIDISFWDRQHLCGINCYPVYPALITMHPGDNMILFN